MSDIEEALNHEVTALQARADRVARLFADPDKLLDVICAHVANGGTAIDLCETWDIPFGHVSNWLNKDKQRFDRYRLALNDRGEWWKERILKELRRLGFSDIRQIFTEAGALKPMSEWPPDVARAVASVEVDELYEGTGKEKTQVGWTKKVKFWDKNKSLESLGKNLKLFVERVESNTIVSLESLVVGSFEATGEASGHQQQSTGERPSIESAATDTREA